MAADGISPSRAQVVGVAFLLVVAFAIPQVSRAFFIDGSELVQFMREYDKAAANAPGVDWKQANEFTMYVAGAYDTLELAGL